MTAARLIDVALVDDPAGIVIVLHGGASRRGALRVSPAQLSVLRMIPVASRVARAGGGRLVVVRLLNSCRGWDARQTPVQDVAWALDQLTSRYGAEVPVCLVGHSLGGRAALLSAGDARVRGVVALAPWVFPDDVATGITDTSIVVIHGDRDRIASPERSAELARRLGDVARVSYVTVRGGAHAMLSHQDQFDGLAARCTAWILLGNAEGAVVQRIAAGDRVIEA